MLASARQSLAKANARGAAQLSAPSQLLWRRGCDLAEQLLASATAMPGAQEKWLVCANLDSAASRLEACTTVEEAWCVEQLGDALWFLGVASGLREAAGINHVRRTKPRAERRDSAAGASKAAQARAMRAADPTLAITKIAAMLDMDTSNVRKALAAEPKRR